MWTKLRIYISELLLGWAHRIAPYKSDGIMIKYLVEAYFTTAKERIIKEKYGYSKTRKSNIDTKSIT